MPTPHDQLVKRIFSRPEVAAAELRAVLPRQLRKRINWDTLRLVRGSFVSEKLRSQHTDLLFTVKVDGKDAFIYILFEHQRSSDEFMPLRLLRYMGAAWEEWRRRHPRAKKLPLIIPVILYQDTKPWTGPTTLHDLIAFPKGMREELARYIPDFELFIDSISLMSERALLERRMPPDGHLVLWSLRLGAGRPLDPAFIELRRAQFAEVARLPDGRETLVAFLSYLTRALADDVMEEVDSLMEGSNDPLVQEVRVTFADKLIRQGLEKGRQEGREEGLEQGLEQGLEKGLEKGRQEGRQEALASVLLKLVTLRFGQPTEATRARVTSASIAELEDWTDRVISVATLDELWG